MASQEKTVLFTVITVAYNSSTWIKEAIESVLASDYIDFEFFISDDCSTDDTWKIIENYNDPRIKAIKQTINIGEYNNRNFAIKNAVGKYVLFVDADDMLYKDTLGKLKSYIDRYPEVDTIWGIPKEKWPFIQLPFLLKPPEAINWIYLANLHPIAQIGFSETIFKRESLLQIGGFATDYITGDTHIKKMLAINNSILLVPAGIIFWRVSSNQASGKLSLNYNGYRNNVKIDKEVIESLKKLHAQVDIKKIEKNIQVRNVKLWVKHTIRKRKFKDAYILFKEFHFRVSDLKYLFIKGDYKYRDQLEG